MHATAEPRHGYHGQIAAAHMVANIPRVQFDTPGEEVIAALHGRHFDCADTVFVTNDSDQLMGIVRINELYGDSSKQIGQIMKEEHEAVLRHG